MTNDGDPIDAAQDELHAASTAAGEARDGLNSHEAHMRSAIRVVGGLEEWAKEIRRAAKDARGEVAEADSQADSAYGDLQEAIEFAHSASDHLDGAEPAGEVAEHRIVDGFVYAVRVEQLGPVSDVEPGLFDPENDAPAHNRDRGDETE